MRLNSLLFANVEELIGGKAVNYIGCIKENRECYQCWFIWLKVQTIRPVPENGTERSKLNAFVLIVYHKKTYS